MIKILGVEIDQAEGVIGKYYVDEYGSAFLFGKVNDQGKYNLRNLAVEEYRPKLDLSLNSCGPLKLKNSTFAEIPFWLINSDKTKFEYIRIEAFN